ncbi:PaaI family thioesterase [Thermodesulforhabdus norvegica]|uniref:Acyl-CoA thioesterase n=1 Tax=Thermodesulforhabdus norvegica TaxID=39841 RepID=A0A1I4S750_9BACT|nr:hotdog fold thioesterase [Thermodesulforhabdus norvegica]SFM60327.1 acyl-CoA thioesterase [Thermodesulforhabdus norvegica]
MQDFLKKYFSRDRYAAHAGIEILEAAPGYAKARMVIRDFHLNGVGIVHGAAIFTLADLVFAVASNSHGQVALAINATISYFKAVSSGTLYAEAEEISLSPRLATYAIRVIHDREGLIALFQGTVYRKKERLEDMGD